MGGFSIPLLGCLLCFINSFGFTEDGKLKLQELKQQRSIVGLDVKTHADPPMKDRFNDLIQRHMCANK